MFEVIITYEILIMMIYSSSKLFSRCSGLEITSYVKYDPDENFESRFSQTIYQYKTYKKMFDMYDKGTLLLYFWL